MEKRRIRLEINGVVCGLITQESEEYMNALAGEVGDMMREILDASPFVTREAAALTVALSYCDDAKKNGKKLAELQDRVDELEVEAELWQEEKAELQKKWAETETVSGEAAARDAALAERARKLEEENTALQETAGRVQELEALAARLEDENAALQKELLSPEKEPQASGEIPAQAPPTEKPAREEAAQAPKRPGRRKNPLRYEEEFQQEGIVSFFEKK